MFIGKEPIMRIVLFTNPFTHNGVRHLSVSVMVKRDDLEIVGVFASSSYATLSNIFDCAFQTATTARSLMEMFLAMGEEVEVSPPLAEYNSLFEFISEKLME